MHKPKLQLITRLAELESNRSRWQSLVTKNPFLDADWMLNWAAEMGPERELSVLVQSDQDGSWTGIAPLCVETTRTKNRKLQFLSSDVACADYLDLICDDLIYERFAKNVAVWLTENIDRNTDWPGFDSFEMKGISKSGRANTQFVPALISLGFQRFETELESCWALELPKTWDELNSRFSKKHRRKTKKAIQHLGDAATETFSTDTQEFQQLWDSFVRLHQKRRESIGQAGCFASSTFQRFLRRATETLVDRGIASVVELRHNSVPFASMLLLKNSRQTFMYQTGMDPAYSKLEPGYQLITLAMQSAIDQGHVSFDFLRGDEPYKARWNTTPVPLIRSRLIPPTFGANLRHQIWLSSRAIKQYATQFGLLN